MATTAPHSFLTDPAAIHKWLDTHCAMLPKYTLDGHIVNVEGDVQFIPLTSDVTRFQVQFGHVTGNFQCTFVPLKTLVGAPHTCDTFNISTSTLESLVGGPTHCRSYVCAFCDGLRSLEGVPAAIRSLDARACHLLKQWPSYVLTHLEQFTIPSQLATPSMAQVRSFVRNNSYLSGGNLLPEEPWRVDLLQPLNRSNCLLTAAAKFEELYGEPLIPGTPSCVQPTLDKLAP